jgi:hypothetical protein
VATNPRHNLGDDEEVLPLLFAKQVEFLRGPASALYGVGAFSGVINVVAADRGRPIGPSPRTPHAVCHGCSGCADGPANARTLSHPRPPPRS